MTAKQTDLRQQPLEVRPGDDLRLQQDYPGEYVAYLESWTGKGNTRALVRRIVAHGTSLKTVNDSLASLSPAQRARVILRYAADPRQTELEVHYDLPGR